MPNLSISSSILNRARAHLLVAAAFGAALALSACGPAPAPTGINDPHEAQNRDFHAFNVDLDKHILRPLGQGYVKAVPQPVAIGVSNFADNLNLPGEVVNDLLQLKLDHAAQNTLRFVVNTTVGLGGVFDPAAKGGLEAAPTDFGETLHVWGMPEGAYIEVPFMGPSTDRDLIGTVVDVAMNPLRLLVPSDVASADVLAKLAAKIGDRGRYSETVDSVLYDSADGYAQARLLYLENRRFQLGQTSSTDTFEDPYAQ